MLEKLVTHEVQDIGELLALADKCALAAEGRAWHKLRAVQPGMTSQNPPFQGQGKKKGKAPEQDVACAGQQG